MIRVIRDKLIRLRPRLWRDKQVIVGSGTIAKAFDSSPSSSPRSRRRGGGKAGGESDSKLSESGALEGAAPIKATETLVYDLS